MRFLLDNDVAVTVRRVRAPSATEHTIGQHVWLRCTEPQASAVLSQHLAEVVGVLDRMADVVIEVRPERLIVSPPRWE